MGCQVVGYLPDVMAEARVRGVLEEHSASLCNVASEAWPAAQPRLVLVAFGRPGDEEWARVIREARERWPDVPIVAFGPHVALDARRQARELGATHVWARGHFFERLPFLVAGLLSSDPMGCDDAPHPLLLQGIELFNRGAYYECHEVLEDAWRQDMRPCRDLYQGILQVGVALHHLREGNEAGALKVVRRALRHLERLPARCQGVDVDFVRERAKAIQHVLETRGMAGAKAAWDALIFNLDVEDRK